MCKCSDKDFVFHMKLENLSKFQNLVDVIKTAKF